MNIDTNDLSAAIRSTLMKGEPIGSPSYAIALLKYISFLLNMNTSFDGSN